MFKAISQIQRSLFSTLVLAEHNGKSVSKNSLKLLSAAHKFGEDVIVISKLDPCTYCRFEINI